MNSNLVLLGLLYIFYSNGYLNLTQTLILLALMSTTTCDCSSFQTSALNAANA